ncbi:MAG: glycoside hydrolase N-terminal domain-containing protein [Pirellulales bacterium]|nr:glycoside hydrolase N-terminal domain-containing protein [Pirellulales bacterium]
MLDCFLRSGLLLGFVLAGGMQFVAGADAQVDQVDKIKQFGNVVLLHKLADEWLEGLPLANGISAAMVWGEPLKVVLSLNHVDFWRDHLVKEIGDYSRHVREAQRLVLAGKTKEANELYARHINRSTLNVMPNQKRGFTIFAGYTNSFQPIGDLNIELDLHDAPTDYRRRLDLAEGMATIDYKCTSGKVKWQCFVPLAEDVVVTRIVCEQPISGCINFARPAQQEYEWTATAAGDELAVDGVFQEGVKSSELAKAVSMGDIGKVTAQPKQPALRFEGVKDLLVVVAVDAGKGEHDPQAICRKKIDTAIKIGFEDMLDRHVAEHRGMFDRVGLSLRGKSVSSDGSTDSSELISQAVKGEYQPELAELVFQMGRYLMMSCNRAGRRPANLQGIWNRHLSPPWDSDWHGDMNIEMNHWLVNPTNLDECNLAVFRQLELIVDQGKRNARKIAGSDGILFYGLTGGDTNTWSPEGGFWTGCAAWLAQHFWRHYEYTLDREFLARRAYPFIKQVGLFYKSFLVKEVGGHYVTGFAHSPENVPPNGFVNVVHTTMDTALVREVMRNLLEAGKILDIDRELWPIWQDLHDNVLPYTVTKEGLLKEWPEPYDERPNHRHFSHLYPLYPGDEFTQTAVPKMVAAARKAVALREAQGRGHNFGWSYPWLACFYARLGEGDAALENLHCMAKGVTVDNLLTCGTEWRNLGLTGKWGLGRLFQIEAGLGASAAMVEMLLQSHQGFIELLPALPTQWPTGQYRGLKARGAFEVDAAWKDGKVTRTTIRSLKGGACKLKFTKPWKTVEIASNGPVKFELDKKTRVISFASRSGKTYVIDFNY